MCAALTRIPPTFPRFDSSVQFIETFIETSLSVSAGINHFHKTPDREWFETDAVLRVSLGNFLFFTILAVIMAGIKDQKDPRDKIHHGGWMAKIFCWVIIVFLMFFVPNGVVSFYGELTPFPSICQTI
jgi:hypothetical protein